MSQHVYKRAFIIDWVRFHGDSNFYDLSEGWYIEKGKLISVPLCQDDFKVFNRDWEYHVQLLSDGGIYLKGDQDVSRFFKNWCECKDICKHFQTSENSIDILRKVKPLVYYPKRILFPKEIITPTFRDIWGYATLTVTGKIPGTLVFYDTCTSTWYQMNDSFATALNILKGKNNQFMVGMFEKDINVLKGIELYQYDQMKNLL